jgi:polyphosphate kinase
MFTADEAIGADATDVFNYLTGYSLKGSYRRLIVAPVSLRERLVALIEREMAHARAGLPARLFFKMNALIDAPIIRQLYEASRAGVRVDLIVRGTCGLRPGVPGVSDRIRVMSIVGRFLEHSRIYHFHNNGSPETFIGSADWQRRNLDDRVEVVLPIRDSEAQGRLVRTLAFCLDDNRLAWYLTPDGRYIQMCPENGEAERSLHHTLMERARRRVADEAVPWDL